MTNGTTDKKNKKKQKKKQKKKKQKKTKKKKKKQKKTKKTKKNWWCGCFHLSISGLFLLFSRFSSVSSCLLLGLSTTFRILTFVAAISVVFEAAAPEGIRMTATLHVADLLRVNDNHSGCFHQKIPSKSETVL